MEQMARSQTSLLDRDISPNLKVLICRLAKPFVFVIMTTFFMNSLGVAGEVVELTDRSLDIERYDDEPLELVEIRIGTKSLKNNIATKYRRPNGVGVDTIKFLEEKGWYRHLQIRMRNVTSKQIYGVRARLFFRREDRNTVYTLPLTGVTRLGQGVLEPNTEIVFEVTEQAWRLTSEILKKHDVDPDILPVSFGIDAIQFDDLQWSKGKMLRRDPNNSNRWIPIDKLSPRNQ